MFIFVILFGVLISSSVSLSYPVFGTKRYHRGGNTKSSIPVYNIQPHHQQQFYDEPYLSDVQSYAGYPADDSIQTNDNYYYLPRRESQYYGLPTYRGEYKPTQYYYAHGPSYSYYDDRNEQANNPLDDLHEEMLQEDERERQRDYPIGEELAYQNPGQRQDKVTSAFLKNLIMYNNMNKDNDNDMEVATNDFEDYSDDNDNGAEYYEPPVQTPAQSFIGLRKFENTAKQLPLIRNDDEKYNDIEDKDVEELRSLANNNKNQYRSQRQQQQQQQQKPQQQQKQQQQQQLVQLQQTLQQQQEQQHQQQQRQRLSEFQQHQRQNEQPNYLDYQQDSAAPALNNYDADPEYDEDSWINWDKRSEKINEKDSVKSERKLSPVSEHFQKISTTQPPKVLNHFVLYPTPTFRPMSSGKSDSLFEGKNGQKEVVLPRPASPVRHPFSAPVMEMLTHNAAVAAEEEEKRENKNSDEVTPTIKTTVYDTIKQLLAMEQNLKNKSQETNKIQKRFVSNESTLAKELQSLKRTAI